MPRIQMYTTRWCGYCVRAKMLLDGKKLAYEEIHLDDDERFRETLHDGRPIGGYSELWRLERAGELDDLLAA